MFLLKCHYEILSYCGCFSSTDPIPIGEEKKSHLSKDVRIDKCG